MDNNLARRSSRELRALFRTAACPDLADVSGRLEAELTGPVLVRAVAPLAFRLTGLGDWWGKDLRSTGTGEVLAGYNLAGPRGERTTLALRGTVGPSRLDGRPAVVLTYPPDAPFPWRRVVDELRTLADGTVLGLTFGLPFTPRDGSPFLLRREVR
ncbi:hypothetical protein [Nocardia aurantiaca]|uniref:Uncharacterized protein n=1 Tax=Nocardia aurantiaca TaxID=2675850 RepID=A0A6I3KVW3_9NOCA|nr:hypothetical protein [Nocardia aurantiaca]MTE12605.1 hypothetical protein [Nocardia aurantiaca]